MYDFFDRSVAGQGRVEVGEEHAHGAGQAQSQEPRRRAEHSESVERSRRDADRRARPKIEGFVPDLDDHAPVQDVVGLRPSFAMRWSGRSPRRIDLEELVMPVGVGCVDLHGDDRVWGGEFDAFGSGGVLNQMRHTSDARFAA